MSDKTVRMTIEFNIDEEALAEHGLTETDVFKSIVFHKNDTVDGFFLSTNIPGKDPACNFFLCNGQVVSKDLVSHRSIGDNLDRWREMIRDEIDLNGAVYGAIGDEIKSMQNADKIIDQMAQKMDAYIYREDYTEYDALDILFERHFSEFLNAFRLESLGLNFEASYQNDVRAVLVYDMYVFLGKDDQLYCQLGDEDSARPLRYRIEDIKEGDAFLYGNRGHIRTTSDNAHQNHDENDEPWIVYGDDGEVYFEEDIGTELGTKLQSLLKQVYPVIQPKPALDVLIKSASEQVTLSAQHSKAPDLGK